MKCRLTREQEVAFMLVSECFGNGSPVALQFCKFLIVEKQGLEWDECPPRAIEPESKQ